MTFIEYPPPGTWRGSPFVRGQRYRVLKEALSYQGHLIVGEVLEYFGAYVGTYYGVSVYAFTNGEGQERTWVLGDEQLLEDWVEVFALATNAE